MSDVVTPPVAPQEEWDVFTGKALIASRSPWGTFAGAGITWLVTHYGFGWDQAMSNLLAGAAVVVASYGMRYITKEPITGILEATRKPSPVFRGK